MEIGKVYRVTNYALSTHWMHSDINEIVVRRSGYLWKCLGQEEDDPDSKYCTCVSLATGENEPWCDEEMEEVT